LELLALVFVSFCCLAGAGFAELPWRLENSPTMKLFALLKIYSIVLFLVFLFGFERARKALVFMVEELVLHL
jgi:hypothetical protein